MTRVALTPTNPISAYAAITALLLDVPLTAADTSNFESVPLTGHEVLLAYNSDTAAHTITVTSIADREGRTGDVTAYSIPAGKLVALSFRAGTDGWKQTDGNLYFQANDPTVKFAVLYIP